MEESIVRGSVKEMKRKRDEARIDEEYYFFVQNYVFLRITKQHHFSG